MSRFRAIGAAVVLCVFASALPSAFAAQDDNPTHPNLYINCASRVAAVFPTPPTIRDFTYTNGERTVPAREFYVQRGMDKFSVTIADFTKGPAIDDTIIENAMVPIRKLGRIQDLFPEDYSAGIPGRQVNIFTAGGRQHRVSLYMADHHLYISQADAAPGDFDALLFEQSVLLLDAEGGDLNAVSNRRHYACKK